MAEVSRDCNSSGPCEVTGVCKERIKMYVAGPWFTEYAKAQLDYFKKIYNEVKDDANLCRYKCYFPDEHNTGSAIDTFNSNIRVIDESDCLVALISEKDVGTAFEIGYARHKDIPIMLIGENEETFKSKTNIMIAFASDKWCITNKQLYNLFKGNIGRDDCVYISDDWEGKE